VLFRSETYQICEAIKIQVVPLGFDLLKFQTNTEEKRKMFRKQYHIADDELVIAIIGRLVPVKNHTLFLEGLKIVSNKTTKKLRAFIIGDGEERKAIEFKAQQLNIEFVDGENANKKALLTFTSWIKDIDIALAGSDIVALTSFNEGTPVSLIEAQAANKPIVSTNVGGIENVVIPNETALLCENNHALAFSEQLFQLIENDDLRTEMSKKGWGFVKEKFHYTRLVGDMEKLYYHLLRK
jgi:glycosyltransferase involved in cell wall biosynthesis